MTLAWVPAVLLAFAIAPAGVHPAAHYLPQVGDSFTFTETISVGGGYGNLTGFWSTDDVNGTLTVTATPANGTDTATFDYVGHYWNSSGGNYPWTEDGPSFTFSAKTFDYVRGTDDQPGEVGNQTWFFMNNSLAPGATIAPLGTELTITSDDATFDLGTGAGGFVSAIGAAGTGTYDNDGFTAQYDYHAYYAPSTGYIVGYVYTENDSDSQGDGFVYVDHLAVTHATYSIPAAASPLPKTYAVTFTESGLPAGRSWTVTFDGYAYSSTTATVTVPAVPNGTYVYLLHSNGYVAASASGTLTVDGPGGGATSQWTVFPATSAPAFTLLDLLVVLVVVIVIVVVVVALLTRRSRRPAQIPQHPRGGMPQFSPPMTGAPPPPISLTPGAQPSIQQVVVKEVVKVKCAYCGSLIDSTATACPFCGATRS